MKKGLFLLALTSTFISCTQVNEDIVKEPVKDGSIEYSIHVEHKDGIDLLTTKKIIWVKNKIDTTFVSLDTLKSLGTTTVDGENSDGDVKKVVVPKNYEIYITVK